MEEDADRDEGGSEGAREGGWLEAETTGGRDGDCGCWTEENRAVEEERRRAGRKWHGERGQRSNLEKVVNKQRADREQQGEGKIKRQFIWCTAKPLTFIDLLTHSQTDKLGSRISKYSRIHTSKVWRMITDSFYLIFLHRTKQHELDNHWFPVSLHTGSTDLLVSSCFNKVSTSSHFLYLILWCLVKLKKCWWSFNNNKLALFILLLSSINYIFKLGNK